MDIKKDSKWINLFFDIIEKAYLGKEFVYNRETFKLQPTLVKPSDFYRRTFGKSLTSYESLLKALDPNFKTVAISEVYRERTGWIAQGIKGYGNRKIRRVKVNGNIFLIPNISKRPTVAIDTSGFGNTDTIIAVCIIPDYEGAYFFLERHLNLPKDHYKKEFHWWKLNHDYKQRVVQNFNLMLHICCDGLLAIKTSALKDRRDKIENLFKNLIDGCFSGYEKDPTQKMRPILKRKFFQAINGVETHCDADFRPLTPEKIVRLLVQTLAKMNGEYESYTPLFANLRSHESKPIQIADIIAGAIRTMIEKGYPLRPLEPLPFDLRKMRKYSDNPPKAYFWFP